MAKKFETVKQYFASLPAEQREPLAQLREIILSAAPGAEECISYQLCAFRSHGKMLVYYGAFNDHVSLFPGNVALIRERFADELQGYVTTKGTIHFPYGKKLPVGLIKKIVKARAADNLEKATAKKKR